MSVVSDRCMASRMFFLPVLRLSSLVTSPFLFRASSKIRYTPNQILDPKLQTLHFCGAGVARARGLVDNTLFAVAKINKIAVGGGRQGAAAAVKETPQIGSGMLEFLMKPF